MNFYNTLYKFFIWIIKFFRIIIENETAKYFIAVLFGGLLTFLTLLIIDWLRNKRVFRNWFRCLLIEIKKNLLIKVAELIYLYDSIQSTGPIIDEEYISVLKCNFGVYQSILNNGIELRDYGLFLKYIEFVLVEEIDNYRKSSYVKEYNSFDSNVDKAKFRSNKLIRIIRSCEKQSIKIREIHDRLEKMLRK